ncbi:MAG: tripartite tricarboxylate transporter TctB family protein [Pararhodobacter sp.]|nr:tripartite tricarboxylate transporter TctB family protein [Pararhodobacter sp.]
MTDTPPEPHQEESRRKSVADTDQALADLLRPRHHRAEIVFALASFSVALFLASQWASQTTWFEGQRAGRQPGLWPLIAIVGMLAFGAAELVTCALRNRRARAGGDTALAEVAFWLRTAEFLGWFLAYVLIVPWTGYLPATLIFCTALAFRLGYRGGMLWLAPVMGAAVVVLFKGFLSVRIPGGAVYEVFPRAIRNFLVLYL